MKTNSVIITKTSTDRSIEKNSLRINTSNDLIDLKSKYSPAVFIIPQKSMEILLKFDEVMLNRGKKNKAKPLSRILLGYKKIPVITTSYINLGQFIRGITSLLTNAIEAVDDNIYFIGVNQQFFDELSQEKNIKKYHTTLPIMKSYRLNGWKFQNQSSNSTLSKLLRMLPSEKISPELLAKYIGESSEKQLVRQLIIKASRISQPVLILGETGTGKGIVAWAIHEKSDRKNKPFVSVNCGAIPRELFESELFGYKKGAFTGAIKDKKGLWESAKNGTLFLDEIGDLTLDHQVKILRALQEGQIRPVGATNEIPVDAKIITATNRNLFSMVQSEHFREDLYYRLREFSIYTPPLRHSPGDLILVAQSIWSTIIKKNGVMFSEDVNNELVKYRWPGNVRELQTVLRNIYSLFNIDEISLNHLRMIYQLQRNIGVVSKKTGMENEIKLHKVDCLNHLKRADEIVRSLFVLLKPLSENKIVSENLQFIFESQLWELSRLCEKPLLFYSSKTYKKVIGLYEKLLDLQELIKTNGDFISFWNRNQIKLEFDEASTILFDEVKEIME